MKFHIVTKINCKGLKMTHEHDQEFDDDSNVFGRMLEYHQYLDRTFPKGYTYEMVSAKEIK